MSAPRPVGLTRTGRWLVALITLLSLAHHADHLFRGAAGWPFDGGFNAFSGSLLVYPVIAAGLVLSRRGRVGSPFWIALAGGGALFVLGVHVGPVAGDDVARIPDAYASPAAGAAAVAVLGALLLALIAHVVHETGRVARARRG